MLGHKLSVWIEARKQTQSVGTAGLGALGLSQKPPIFPRIPKMLLQISSVEPPAWVAPTERKNEKVEVLRYGREQLGSHLRSVAVQKLLIFGKQKM